jgi:hypothetical protein
MPVEGFYISLHSQVYLSQPAYNIVRYSDIVRILLIFHPRLISTNVQTSISHYFSLCKEESDSIELSAIFKAVIPDFSQSLRKEVFTKLNINMIFNVNLVTQMEMFCLIRWFKLKLTYISHPSL